MHAQCSPHDTFRAAVALLYMQTAIVYSMQVNQANHYYMLAIALTIAKHTGDAGRFV
jgi:hypothetical protein